MEVCCGSIRFALVPAALRLNIDALRASALIEPSFEEDAGAKVGGRGGGRGERVRGEVSSCTPLPPSLPT